MKATQYFKLISNHILFKSIKWNAVFEPLFPFLSPPVPSMHFFGFPAIAITSGFLSTFELYHFLPDHATVLHLCYFQAKLSQRSPFSNRKPWLLIYTMKILFRIENKTNVTHSLWIETEKKTDWLSCSPFESMSGILNCYLTGNCIYISEHLIWNLFS